MVLVLPKCEMIHYQPVPCGDVADCGWSLFDDLQFDIVYDASESVNQPEVVEEEPQKVWTWERIGSLDPFSLPLSEENLEVPTAYACKWSRGRTHQNEARSALVIIRDVLNELTEKKAMGHVWSYLIAQSHVNDNNQLEEMRQIVAQFA
ncbi:hypothetical protein CQW23_22287 [Capsicum baccatum]|uniref:Uncharacterized protein n=1 Tax=Capsicum baccatum TaxID=33114 RepID=A0A2G2W0F4_CAPBA|nr:hypothetical protein CQW23_22287 [Capsicum baccatum]